MSSQEATYEVVTVGETHLTTGGWFRADIKAAELLLTGHPCVEVYITCHAPSPWDPRGERIGERGLLQAYCPREQSIAPDWCWTTSCFTPHHWRSFSQTIRDALTALG